MELQLQPRAGVCSATGAAFAEGDRVVSLLVRDGADFRRCDFLAEAETRFMAPGEVLCRWTRVFKPVVAEANPEQALKLTAESLFLALTGEDALAADENASLEQFLALLLERKRVLKRRGVSVTGNVVYEHMPSRRMIEIPAVEMDAAFFLGVREKLGALLGEPAPGPEATGP